MNQIPAHCPSCGAVFQSRLISIGGNVKNLVMSGNTETCPFCGKRANTAEGIFSIANNVISIVSAPHITKQMISAMGNAIQSAYERKSPIDDLADELAKIDKPTSDAVRAISNNKSLYLTVLLMIILAFKSCTVNVNIDANRLVDQVRGVNPTSIASPEKP